MIITRDGRDLDLARRVIRADQLTGDPQAAEYVFAELPDNITLRKGERVRVPGGRVAIVESVTSRGGYCGTIHVARIRLTTP